MVTCVHKASETGLVDAGELAAAKKMMTDDQYQQEFECSRTANISGSVYGKILEKMDNEKRLGRYPYDPGSVSYTHLTLPTIYSV